MTKATKKFALKNPVTALFTTHSFTLDIGKESHFHTAKKDKLK